jgi:hypothetical protein
MRQRISPARGHEIGLGLEVEFLKVIVLYVDRPLSTLGAAALLRAVYIQRLEGSRFVRGRCSMGVE